MRQAVLIAGRELKNEQGAQEVGERMAPALHYLNPSQWEKSTPGRPDENLLFLSTGCSVCLLLCLGCDSYSCVRRDAQVKAHLCHRGAVTTSASRLTEVMRILPNDSLVLGIAEFTFMSCMFVSLRQGSVCVVLYLDTCTCNI